MSHPLACIVLAACGPAPRPRPAAPAPVRVVAVAPPASPSPPPEASSAPPPPEEPLRPGCALSDAQNVIGRGALVVVGANVTRLAAQTVVTWATGSASAGFVSHGVGIDSHGNATGEVAPATLPGRTVSIGRVSAMAGADGIVHLVTDRRYRDEHAEYVECGPARGQVARLTERGEYEEEGTSIHFDLATCRTIIAGEQPFIVGAVPANDEDLFAGVVYLHAQWWTARPGQLTRLWSYPQSQDVFDRDMPWLHAIAIDAPSEPVGVAISGGGYAVAWRYRGLVYLQWLGADLAPRGVPQTISTRTMQSGVPQLSTNGQEVLAVFSQRTGASGRSSIHAVRLPVNGRPMPRVVIAQGAEDSFAPSAVAVGGSGWAVTWSQSAPPARRGAAAGTPRVFLRMYDTALRPIDDAQVAVDGASDSRVASFDEGRVVLTAMRGDGSERDIVTRGARCGGRE